MKLSLKRSLWPRGESSCVWWLPPMTSMSNPCQVIVTKKKKKPEVTLSNRKQNKIKSVMENVNTGHRWSRPSLWNVHAESQHGNLCSASSAEPEAGPAPQTGRVLNLAGCLLLQLPGPQAHCSWVTGNIEDGMGRCDYLRFPAQKRPEFLSGNSKLNALQMSLEEALSYLWFGLLNSACTGALETGTRWVKSKEKVRHGLSWNPGRYLEQRSPSVLKDWMPL